MSDLTWTPVRVRLGQIKPWTHNPRMSTKAQAQRLIKSERELGQPQTLAVSPFVDGFCDLYDGHQRVAAWNTIKGADFEVWALQSNRPLSDDERRKISILLHTATGQWEWDKLAAWSAADLQEWGFDRETLQAWNNDANNLKEMLAANEPEGVDAEPQIDGGKAIERWQVKQGDLFVLGKHKLLCGNSTQRSDIERLTENKPYCVLTDPPYNIGFEYNGIDDKMSKSEYSNFCKAWFEAVSDAVCLIFSPGPKNTRLYPEPRDVGYWLKRYASAGASAFNLRTIEPLLIYGKVGNKRNFDLFDYSSGFPDELKAAQRAAFVEDKHPPAKPIGLWLDIMDMLPDLPVVDCFSGNGTSFMAAEQKGRVCYGNEQDPSYCALILERMSQAFPGIEIKRIDT